MHTLEKSDLAVMCYLIVYTPLLLSIDEHKAGNRQKEKVIIHDCKITVHTDLFLVSNPGDNVYEVWRSCFARGMDALSLGTVHVFHTRETHFYMPLTGASDPLLAPVPPNPQHSFQAFL